jgi:hypothetical protein
MSPSNTGPRVTEPGGEARPGWVRTEKNGLAHSLKEPSGLLDRHPQPAAAFGASEFRDIADEAYDHVQGDTVQDLLHVREAMRDVLYNEDYDAEFGFNHNQESTHPAVAEYQRVNLTALANHINTKYPDAETLRITESDDAPGSWGEMALFDEDGEQIRFDDAGEEIALNFDIVSEGETGDYIDTSDLLATFGISSIVDLDDSVKVDYDKHNGFVARVDLTKAPRTLR